MGQGKMRCGVSVLALAAGVTACSSGSDTSPTPCADATANDVAAICEKVVALPCRAGMPQQACQADITASTTKASQGVDDACCRAALAELLRCGAEHGVHCAMLSDDVLFAPDCSSVEEKWDQCSGSNDNCTEVLPAGKWLIECDQYGADCSMTAAGAFDCACTSGPHLGVKFAASSGDNVAVIAKNCK